MRQIRSDAFETNSSSTHSITMCSAEDYNKWKNGELLVMDCEFYTREEAIKNLKENKWFIGRNQNLDWEDANSVNETLKDNGYKTYNEYGDTDFETFEESFVTKNGEKVFAFGRYGYDG